MTNIRNLFDFQKIAGNKELEAIIKGTESRYGVELSDDDLELAAAGRYTDTGYNTVEKYCEICKAMEKFKLMSGGRAVCTKCGEQIML